MVEASEHSEQENTGEISEALAKRLSKLIDDLALVPDSLQDERNISNRARHGVFVLSEEAVSGFPIKLTHIKATIYHMLAYGEDEYEQFGELALCDGENEIVQFNYYRGEVYLSTKTDTTLTYTNSDIEDRTARMLVWVQKVKILGQLMPDQEAHAEVESLAHLPDKVRQIAEALLVAAKVENVTCSVLDPRYKELTITRLSDGIKLELSTGWMPFLTEKTKEPRWARRIDEVTIQDAGLTYSGYASMGAFNSDSQFRYGEIDDELDDTEAKRNLLNTLLKFHHLTHYINPEDDRLPGPSPDPVPPARIESNAKFEF